MVNITVLVCFSDSWLKRFKRHYGWTQRVQHGEAQAVDENGAAQAKTPLSQLLQNFSHEDIYNMYETSGFYCQLPARRLMRSVTPKRRERHRSTALLFQYAQMQLAVS